MTAPKDTIPNYFHGAYEVPCSDCSRSYISQTNRRINNWIYEFNVKLVPGSALQPQHYTNITEIQDKKILKTQKPYREKQHTNWNCKVPWLSEKGRLQPTTPSHMDHDHCLRPLAPLSNQSAQNQPQKQRLVFHLYKTLTHPCSSLVQLGSRHTETLTITSNENR